MAKTWSRPEPLGADHVVEGFSCGKESLDEWLAQRAKANQITGATRTYVTVSDGRVVGFYSLSSGSIAGGDATGRARRNRPDPIPAVLLARFAVDSKHQGAGLGKALLRSALEQAQRAAEALGIACILVHAKDEDAKSFYLHFGFEPSPTDEMHLLLLLKDLKEVQGDTPRA